MQKQTEAVTDGVVYEYYGEGTEIVKSATTYEGGSEKSRDVYDYWSDGSLKSVTTIENGNEVLVSSYLYSDGKMTQNVREFEDNEIKCKEVYFYDGSNTPSKVDYYEDGEKTGSYRYTYNDEGKTLTEEQLDPTGAVLSYIEYEYSPDNVVQKAKYYEFGSMTKYWTYLYDEKGLNTEIITYNSRDQIILRTKNTYDENGEFLTYETSLQ